MPTEPARPSALKRFWVEARRRQVPRVAVGYVVVGFGLLEGFQLVYPTLGIDPWVYDALVVVVVLGFPASLVLSWVYDFSLTGLERTPGEPRSVEESVPAPAPGSIAVLPFSDLSAERDQEHLAEGVAEEIIHALARVEGLRVAARTSTFAAADGRSDIRDIGRRLGVGAVLEGSVRKAGSKLRITTQLIDVRSGYHLWSELFERELTDIFAIQDEITAAIVATVAPKLGGRQPTAVANPSIQAYELYLKGRQLWYNRFRVGLMLALEHFQKAQAADPSYALPYTGIADTMVTLGYMGLLDPAKARAAGVGAAEQAHQLDPGLPQGHFSLGMVHAFLVQDLERAQRHLELSFELGGNRGEARIIHALVVTLTGDLARGRAMVEEARAADPGSLYVRVQAAHELLWAGDPEAATREFDEILEREPGHLTALLLGGIAYHGVGDYERCLALFEKATELSGGAATARSGVGVALARLGRTDEARAVLAELRARSEGDYVAPALLALVHANLGELDEALEQIDLAIAEKSPFLLLSIRYSLWNRLWGDPRFEDVERRLGVPARRELAVVRAG